MNSSIPTETKVVIVGGGIMGCSLAYHLTKFGWKDVVLLEQKQLAGGTTWHAAGLVGRLRTSNSMTKINKYSVELYAGLEVETGHNVGWKQVGSLIVGRSEERMTQLRRTTAMAELFGVEAQLITPAEAQDKWPLLRIDDLRGAAWLPHDGKVVPKEVALALVKAAQSRGAQVIEDICVHDVLRANGRAIGVTTDQGTIKAEHVVLCGGMWTRELGLRCGVTIPLYPVEHHYVVTEPLEGAYDELPVGRDPDLCIYFRGEGNAVLLGAFQEYSKPWMVDQIPADFSFRLLDADWEKFAQPLAAGKHRIPSLETAPFARFVNGPESFTPDNNFILGEAPELRNLFVAAGFNSVGIASAGGAGKYLAEWMIEGRPTLDLWSVDIRRFGPIANNLPFLRERVTEILGLHYQMAWPNREFTTGRGLRRTPLHDRLAAAGACFGNKNGWERPNWFARDGMKPQVEYSFGRQNWFPCHAHEHRAAREVVAIFDQTGFSKFLFKGRDVVAILQRLCGNDVDVPVGRIVYTAMLNERGGFESDLTVVRLAEKEYYLVSGTAQTVRDQDWITRHIRADERAEMVDMTGQFSVLGVMGPQSRNLLLRLTDADLSNTAFPFATGRTIRLGPATVRALRLTYVGELGWELHVPMSQACALYDALMEAGRELGVVNAGHYAINSLRLEKGYRAWGVDLSPDDTPLEAGLEFALAWNKSIPFLGRDALLKQKEIGLKRRLALFTLQNPEPMLWGSEPILRDGVPIGYTTSGAFAHTLGNAVALGYVSHDGGFDAQFINNGRFEINIAGERYPARAHLRTPYDPQRKRILS
jgi:glycine cleavage system aminomethyltransferase T/glycine/D-amino acid oxidase-like deaminating enzyme